MARLVWESRELWRKGFTGCFLADVEIRNSRMTGDEINPDGAAATPIINFAHFDLMVDGPDSPCVAIYRDWVNAAVKSIAELCEAASRGNSQQAASLAHQLKGSSAALGLVGFSSRMMETEKNARSGADLGSVLDAGWREATLRLLDATTAMIEAERGINR